MENTERTAAKLIDLMTAASATGQHIAAQQYWEQAVAIINARTPEKIRQMEVERGLI